MQGAQNKILTRIAKRGRGWAFSKVDFAADFRVDSIQKALTGLEQIGQIRRVMRGVYDYPKKSRALGGFRSPDMDQVAKALARKFGWRIQPTGEVALNLLGLSTQVPARWIYASDGPNRTYEIGVQSLEFRKTPLRESAFNSKDSGLLVQAIKALGRERIEDEQIRALKKQFAHQDGRRIIQETKLAPDWIHAIIRSIWER